MVICHFGAHAEMIVTSAQFALPMPEDMSFEEAACVPWNYLVAHHLIFRVACVRPGERVLVHMAAGGVGMAAIQLLRTIPHTVTFGTASGSKHDALRAEGCRHAIDYRASDYAKEVTRITDGTGLDVVLDPLGGDDWRKGFNLLRPTGRLVAYGCANMMTGERRSPAAMIRELLRAPRFSPLKLLETNRSVAGVSTGRFWRDPQLLTESLTAAVERCCQYKLRPRVDSVYSFDQVTEAHRRIEGRNNTGKVILTP
jgi:NADPH:quinone reductase-like Zn-dependent oxidoreductase